MKRRKLPCGHVVAYSSGWPIGRTWRDSARFAMAAVRRIRRTRRST